MRQFGFQSLIEDMTMTTQNYNFTLEIANYTDFDDELVDRAFECGCNDGSFSVIDDKLYFDVDREADSLNQAITSVVRQLNRADLYVSDIFISEDTLEGKKPNLSLRKTEFRFSFYLGTILNKSLASKLIRSPYITDFFPCGEHKTCVNYVLLDVEEDNAFFKATKDVTRITGLPINWSAKVNDLYSQ